MEQHIKVQLSQPRLLSVGDCGEALEDGFADFAAAFFCSSTSPENVIQRNVWIQVIHASDQSRAVPLASHGYKVLETSFFN